MTQPKHVKSLSAYRALIDKLGTFRIAHALPNQIEQIKALGFDGIPVEGDSLLPSPTGKYSIFNATGGFLIRKDLPKVSESYMSHRQWKDWHGNMHSGIQIRTMKIFPREKIPPPEEYLTVLNGPTELLLCTRPLSLANDSEELIVHLVNLYLEIFGSLKLVGKDLNTSVSVKHLNWKILPAGPFPFARAKTELATFLDTLKPEAKPVIELRIKSITNYNPDFLALGLGGFSDYVVFGFTKTGTYIFESPVTGNATYIFKDNWQALSLLTKKQILDGSLHESRLIHNHKWRTALREAIIK